MALSEARKRANNKWAAANMVVLGCKVKRDKAERFKEACNSAGTTPNAVFASAIDAFLSGSPNAPGLPLEVLDRARSGAKATGETIEEFVVRAVETQIKRDSGALALGVNPADKRE